MMAHLDEGVLQAYLDAELTGPDLADADRHLEACGDCNAMLDDLRGRSHVVSSAFALLDPDAAQRTAQKPPPSVSKRSSWGAAPLRRAAVLLLTFAAAASATIPGSPVRQWIGARFDAAPRPMAMEEAPDEPVATTLAADAPPESGVSVEPANGRLRIVLTRAAPELMIRAQVVDSRLGGVYATGDASSARFRTGQGLIEVLDAGPGELRIEVPRTAESAAIVIDGRTYFAKQGQQLRLEVPARDSSETEVLFQVQP